MQMRTSVKGRSCDWWCNCKLLVLREFGGGFLYVALFKAATLNYFGDSISKSSKERRIWPYLLRGCVILQLSGTGLAPQKPAFTIDLPRIHQFILVWLLSSVRFACILLVCLQCLALRLVQVMEGNNKCSIWSRGGWLPPVHWRNSWV